MARSATCLSDATPWGKWTFLDRVVPETVVPPAQADYHVLDAQAAGGLEDGLGAVRGRLVGRGQAGDHPRFRAAAEVFAHWPPSVAKANLLLLDLMQAAEAFAVGTSAIAALPRRAPGRDDPMPAASGVPLASVRSSRAITATANDLSHAMLSHPAEVGGDVHRQVDERSIVQRLRRLSPSNATISTSK